MFSSSAFTGIAKGRRTHLFRLLILSGTLLAVFWMAGCGGGDKPQADQADNSAVIAKVGDTDITAAYYEDRLAQLAENELPKENGQPMDMSTEAGKRAFLDVLINKELMRQKALELGYDKDPNVMAGRKSMTEYEGGLAMWNDVVGDVSNQISEEELQAFYDKMGTNYLCNYVICNFRDDALEAMKYAQTGADWEDVVAKFHDGKKAPTGKYEINVPFGQYSSEYEDKVFATPVGGISEPIPSSYGWWIVRVIKVEHKDKPDLATAKANILDVTRNRKIGRLRSEFKKEVHKKYNFKINEDALWAVYQAMPDQGLMDPETGEPFGADKLEKLDVPSTDLGLVLYSYDRPDGEQVKFTVADYQNSFNKMSIFQRPKKGDMLGGLRQKITGEVERGLMNMEAEQRGYFEKPDVLAKVNKKVEEIMVTRLYKDVVTFDDKVTPEQLDAFWAEHEGDYHVPEARTGHLVVCLSQQKAEKARQAILDGAPWKSILVKFGSDAKNKSVGGKTEQLFAKSKSPLAGPLFSLEKGGVSEPFPAGNGRYALVQLDNILPAHNYKLNEVSEALGGRIRKQRQEAAFKDFLAKWTQELGVEIYAENLAGLKSWKELTTVPVPENLVPRN